MKKTKGIALLALGFAASVSVMTEAGAVDPMGKIPVLERTFDEFTPKGFNLGLFNVKPYVTAGVDYTSNTLKSDNNEISERIYRTVAGLTAVRDTEQSELTLAANIDDLNYQTTDAFDHTNMRGFIGFVYTLNQANEVTIEGTATQTHQTAYETGTINAAYNPTEVRQYDMDARWRYKPGTIRWDFLGRVADRSYEDTQFTATGAPLIQSDRDNTLYSLGMDVAFERLSGGLGESGITPFLGFKIDRTDFDRRDYSTVTSDFTGVDQSNWQYDLTAGVEFSPTGKLRGTARVGYGLYRPDDGALDDQSSTIVDIDLTYLYSPLTNFIFGAERFFTNNTDDVGGTLETRLSAKIIHELTRQWIFDAGISYAERSFSDTVEDDTWISGAGVTYRINDRFSVLGDVKYITRESNQQNGDYDETKAMIRLNTRF